MYQSDLQLHDLMPATETFYRDVIAGLNQSPKTLPCKYFYDQFGARLFDLICDLDEYYPTRTERAIMEKHVSEMARCLGPECLLIEPGSGTGEKARFLLQHMEDPAAYIPIEITREFLLCSARDLDESFGGVEVLPVCADFHQEFQIPLPEKQVRRRILFFPGSTFGNFHESVAERFLRRFVRVCGPGGGILLGIDLRKDREVLERAYNDDLGITSAFNLNLLRRINRELHGNFDLNRFRHRAIYNKDRHRIEMHLESTRDQEVRLDGKTVSFRRGETIRTECSYKYSIEDMGKLFRKVGGEIVKTWEDGDDLYSVVYARIPPRGAVRKCALQE